MANIGEVEEIIISQQPRDANLATVLVSTVCMFFFCHAPRYRNILNLPMKIRISCRLVTSIYEAANIHSILDCRDKGQEARDHGLRVSRIERMKKGEHTGMPMSGLEGWPGEG